MSPKEFWKWFQENKNKDSLADELLAQLHRYCNKLYFEIEGDGLRRLIISAGGDLQFFDEVEQLVAEAPDMNDWVVIAFKPPIEISTEKVWFMPLPNVSIGGIGLRLYFEDFDESREEAFLETAYELLDTILGEKLSAEAIRYVEVAKFADEDLYALHDLPEYIESLQ